MSTRMSEFMFLAPSISASGPAGKLSFRLHNSDAGARRSPAAAVPHDLGGLRACLETLFGVPPSGGTTLEPPKGGTPNPRPRILGGFFKHALLHSRLKAPGCGKIAMARAD